MELKTKDLKSALDRCAKVVGHRQTLPILACVKISATGGILEIHASNLDEHMVERVECNGDLGPVCVNFTYLQNALGGDEVELTQSENRIKCKFGVQNINLPTLSADEFVPLPADKFVKTGVSCPDATTGIRSVVWAASKDSSRYLLNSVHLLSAPKMLRCESSNGRELAIWEMPLIGVEFEALIPMSFAHNFADAMERDGSCLSLSEKFARVEHANGLYFCKQIEAKFFDTNHISMEPNTAIGTLLVEELRPLFRQCTAYALPQRTPSAIVSFSTTGCAIEFSSNAELSLKIPGCFKPSERVLNAESFLNCLENLPDGQVQINGGDRKLFLHSGNLLVITTEMSSI